MTLGEGMKNKAAELGEVVTGRLLSGEQYLGTDVSFAVFEKGEMRYYKKANLTAFIPFV